MARLSPAGTLSPLDYKRYFARVRAVGGPDVMVEAFRVTMRRWPDDADKAHLGAKLAVFQKAVDDMPDFDNGETGFGGKSSAEEAQSDE